MQVGFLHLADVHLGYQQYGSTKRFNDSGRAFLAAVDYAVEQEVDLRSSAATCSTNRPLSRLPCFRR